MQNAVRKALGDVGAGKIGPYSHCSFSVKGIGRFVPLSGSQASVGNIGELQEVAEEKVEIDFEEDIREKVVYTLRKHHPYEEIIYSITEISK